MSTSKQRPPRGVIKNLEGDYLSKFENPGEYKIKIIATDDKGGVSKEYYTVTVKNRPPEILEFSDGVKAARNKPFRVVEGVRDLNGDEVVSTLEGGKYSGREFSTKG